jgi:hypothetical protein
MNAKPKHNLARSNSICAALIALLLLLGTSASLAQLSLDALEGASIVANDGQFLGIISQNHFKDTSISNEFGKYGSKFSSTSIFNEFGKYGGEFSSLSPFNQFTSTPPKILTKDNKWAYLTANTSLSPRISPVSIVAWMNAK